jgi:alanine racemase
MPNTNPDTTATPADADQAGAILEIDLDALGANYNNLRHRAAPAECGAVLKADAYGLGADQVGPKLAALGCHSFFVAHLAEGVALRHILGGEPAIYILNGPLPRTEADFLHHDLLPVLNSPRQLEQWSAAAAIHGQTLGAGLQIDTGMARLGLSPVETAELAANPGRLAGLDLHFIASHLACADEPGHAFNGEQRQAFQQQLTALPPAPGSLANSAGIFLGPDYHYDLVRPGIALYGGNPTPGAANPMGSVVRLAGKIIQIREIDTPQSVGYGATHRVTGRRRIATIPVGYADGYPRALSGRGRAGIAGVSVPVVGRVSMDLITLDVTEAPVDATYPGAMVDLIGGGGPSLDEVAEAAGTIGYEILTALGRRYHRQYLPVPKYPDEEPGARTGPHAGPQEGPR